MPVKEFRDLRRRNCMVAMGALMLGAPLAAAPRPVQVLFLPERSNRAFAQALFDLIAKGGGFEWDYRYVPWPRLMSLAAQGEGLGWGLAPESENIGDFVYSEPLFNSGVWLVGRAGDRESSTGLEGLRGRTLCLRRGFGLGLKLRSGRGTVFQVIESDQGPDAQLRMLAGGRCDRLLLTYRSTDPVVMERWLASVGPSDTRFFVERPPLSEEGVYVAAAKGRKDLAVQLQRVNLGLRMQAKAIQAVVASDL